MTHDTRLTIFTDGGSRGNPGNAAYGFVISQGEKKLHEEGEYIGITTNNVAEYTAIIKALSWVVSHRESIGEYSGITVNMDSLLACQQLNNIFRVKQPHLAQLLLEVRRQEREVGVPVSYKHVYREYNTAADAMVNKALDQMQPRP